MEKTIKSCPFCGGEAKATDIDLLGWWHVECVDCKAQSRTFERRKKAVAAWNARAERTCRNVSEFGSNVGGWRDWDTDGFEFECSECGCSLESDEMGASPLKDTRINEPVEINFCPGCGAQVIKEER